MAKQRQHAVTLYIDEERYQELRRLWGQDPTKIPKSFQHFLQCIIDVGIMTIYGGGDKQ